MQALDEGVLIQPKERRALIEKYGKCECYICKEPARFALHFLDPAGVRKKMLLCRIHLKEMKSGTVSLQSALK